jgi:hypothetical protein
MRTKTLLLAAAMLAVGLATSSAQSVYSQNVVGYINQVIPPGFSMIANQLDTGTNTLGNLLPNVPQGTIVYKFTSAGGYTGDNFFGGVWGDPTVTLNPGEGAFIYNPGSSPITNAFVGTVFQGTNNVTVPAGFSMQGYPVPVVGGISANFSYPAVNGDILYLWSGGTFVGYNYFGGGWTLNGSPQEPIINVGQAFFIYHAGSNATNWVVSFTVGQ